MAIDTAARRASVQSYTFGLVRPLPDPGVSAADRAQVAWFYRGLSYASVVHAADRMPTTFVASVPAGAVFMAGTAYAQTGERYVADLPADPVFLRGIAYRQDGAMCINAAGIATAFLAGWGLTDDGEVVASTDGPEVYHNGVGLTQGGAVCMTEVA